MRQGNQDIFDPNILNDLLDQDNGTQYLMMYLDDGGMRIIHKASRKHFEINAETIDWLDHFANLLFVGTKESFKQAQTLKKCLLNWLPSSFIQEVEDNTFEAICSEQLIQ